MHEVINVVLLNTKWVCAWRMQKSWLFTAESPHEIQCWIFLKNKQNH